MNWKFLLPRFVLASLLWAFLKWGFDPASRHGLKFVVEQSLGGRADVGRVMTTFGSPSVSVTAVAIADRDNPRTNLVEFDELRLELAGQPLLHRCYVVDNARLSGLRWNTPRSEPGAIENWKPMWKRNISLGGLPDLDFDLSDTASDLGREWLDEMLTSVRTAADPNQLESVRVARQLEVEWPRRFEGLEKRVKALESRIDHIQTAVREKGKTLERIEAYQRALQDVQKLLAEIEDLRDEVRALPGVARTDFTRLNEAKDRDLETLRRPLELARLDQDALSDALLGGELRRRLGEALTWVKRIQEFSQQASADLEPTRSRGREILFPRVPATPAFVLRNLTFDGTAQIDGSPVSFEGTVADVSSNPKLYGRPVTFRFTGDGASALELRGSIDRTGDSPSETLQATWTRPGPSTMQIGGKSLALQVSAGNTVWTAEFRHQGDRSEGTIHLRQSPIVLALMNKGKSLVASANTTAHGQIRTVSADAGEVLPSELTHAELKQNAAAKVEAVVEVVVQDALASTLRAVDRVDAKLSFTSSGGAVRTSLETDLGAQLAEGLENGLAETIENRRQELVDKVDTEVQERTTNLRNMMGTRYNALLADLTDQESTIKSLLELAGGLKPAELKMPATTDDVRNLKSKLESLPDPRKLLKK